MVETRIVIEHLPRFQRITVTSPGQTIEFRIEAPPTVALKALADYLNRWATEGRRPQNLAEVFGR